MSKDFWKGAGERAGKTFLQVGIATLGISATATYTAQTALALPWETALVTATVSALLSLVTSILNPSFTAGGSGIAGAITGSVIPDVTVDGAGDVTSEDTSGSVTDTPVAPTVVQPDGEGVATIVTGS